MSALSAQVSFDPIEENAKIVTEEQGIQDIVNAMNAHGTNAALLEAACAALWTLSVEGMNQQYMGHMGIVKYVSK